MCVKKKKLKKVSGKKEFNKREQEVVWGTTLLLGESTQSVWRSMGVGGGGGGGAAVPFRRGPAARVGVGKEAGCGAAEWARGAQARERVGGGCCGGEVRGARVMTARVGKTRRGGGWVLLCGGPRCLSRGASRAHRGEVPMASGGAEEGGWRRWCVVPRKRGGRSCAPMLDRGDREMLKVGLLSLFRRFRASAQHVPQRSFVDGGKRAPKEKKW